MKKEKSENEFRLKHLTRDDVRELLKNNIDIIAVNIRKQMIAKNITQESLAIAVRSEQSHISNILSKHKKGITINVLGRIAAALDVSIADLSTEQPKSQYKPI